jgi:UDP-N-acetylmuramyl pentapeptide phosphotransferase/UDP-N-acetylglucosamine-1-phosphate transferase
MFPDLPPLPFSAWLAFAVSFAVALLLVLSQRWHGRFSMDGTAGIQKAHTHPTPRIGGVAIVAGVVAAWSVAHPSGRSILGPLLMAGIAAFVFGLAEDLTKRVSVLARLLATMLSGVVGWFITGVSLTSLHVPGLDWLLTFTGFSVMFTAFAIGGVANAVNIVDGFNGLASGFVTLAMMGLTLIALSVGDTSLAFACLAIAAAMLGFFVVNWPWGKLFLGDGGSYFGGFALAWAAVLLVERNDAVTPLAALLLCIHPVFEVLFSIFRRFFRKEHPGEPDRLHLHSLLHRRVISRWQLPGWLSNSFTGLAVALLTAPAVLLALWLHRSPLLAALASLFLSLGYLALYARLVHFRWCSPLAFFIRSARRPARIHVAPATDIGA